MTIQEQHYDLKLKLNKLDSQQYRNLLIPQIDWILNEAQELFVKMIAEPRTIVYNGFEIGNRNLHDIRTIVVDDELLIPNANGIITLPDNYWFYISSYAMIRKGNCAKKTFKTIIRQHDDDFENSPFDRSSFEWKTINGIFNLEGLKLYKEDFEIDKFYLSYIKKLKYIHNAKDFQSGSYKVGDKTLTGSVNCELPEHTHREIVDIAVLIATGAIQIPDYQIKRDKLTFNQIN